LVLISQDLRYLGKIRALVKSDVWRRTVLTEMTARYVLLCVPTATATATATTPVMNKDTALIRSSVLKCLLKALLRRRMTIIRVTSESAYRQAVVDFFNLVFGNHPSSRSFWCAFFFVFLL
jgi:hypothetical protein